MNVVLALVVSIGVYKAYGRPYVPAVVDSVVAGKPAQRAGLTRGDSIAAVDGHPVKTGVQVVDRVSASTRGDVTLDVVRGGAHRSLVVRPEPTEVTDPSTGERRTVGRIGVAPRGTIIREPVGVGEAVREGWDATWQMAGNVIGTVRGLLTGRVGVSNLGGPIAIARTSVAAARSGLEELMVLVAFLSINIAILNLLPIPVLDGGQVLLNVAEAVKGSAFSQRTREYILRAGLAAIALLFVTVMWNDLARLAGDIFRR